MQPSIISCLNAKKTTSLSDPSGQNWTKFNRIGSFYWKHWNNDKIMQRFIISCLKVKLEHISSEFGQFPRESDALKE